VTQTNRALVISTVGNDEPAADRMGSASYSYHYVCQSFLPLLRRWGGVTVAARDLETADGAIHLSFRPLDFFCPTAGARNAAFPFWDFPDVPAYALGGNPRNDWVAIANSLDLLLTSSEFTRDAFMRSGVRVPIRVVPVPVRRQFFELAAWEPQRRLLDCPAYELTSDGVPRLPASSHATSVYHRRVRPHLSRRSIDLASALGRSARTARAEWRDITSAAPPPLSCVELSGIVYTTVLNPFDQRKNWEDLLTAFLFALRDHSDATLVVKLVVPPQRAAFGVNRIVRFWRTLGIGHRCRVVLISAYLDDAQMLELTGASTYYLNASRAEGACLPLQDFLAAGRPAVAPRHSAIADYFDSGSGLVVESHPEPTSWPQDPDGRCTTIWHRLVWTSLRDRIAESYDMATHDRAGYARLSANAQARMHARASDEAVWAQLEPALDSIEQRDRRAL